MNPNCFFLQKKLQRPINIYMPHAPTDRGQFICRVTKRQVNPPKSPQRRVEAASVFISRHLQNFDTIYGPLKPWLANVSVVNRLRRFFQKLANWLYTCKIAELTHCPNKKLNQTGTRFCLFFFCPTLHSHLRWSYKSLVLPSSSGKKTIDAGRVACL